MNLLTTAIDYMQNLHGSAAMLSYLEGQGVRRLDALRCGLGMCPVDADLKACRWQPAESGETFLTLPVDFIDLPVIDILAWRPEHPSGFCQFNGLAPYLGYGYISERSYFDRPVRFTSDIYEWLRFRGDAFLPLDDGLSRAIMLTCSAGFLVSKTADGERADQLMREPPRSIPPIQVERRPVNGA